MINPKSPLGSVVAIPVDWATHRLVSADTVRPVEAFAQLNSWPARHKACAVVGSDGAISSVGPVDHVFHLASVTKIVFAYTILIAIEEGSLSVEQQVGEPGSHSIDVDGPITVAHLLSHSSGLAPERPNDQTRPSPPTAPGRRRIYSNYGFELLGQALQDSTAMSAAEYVEEAVAGPLGMRSTKLQGSPAHGAHSTVADMTLFVAEVLRPTLISPETLELATHPFLEDLSGVLPGYGRQEPNPWGLGFEIRADKSPHWTGRSHSARTFGHFGRSGTFVWIDPAIEAGCVVLTDEQFGPWAVQAWPPFNDAVVTELST